jgi:hypothetical protein
MVIERKQNICFEYFEGAYKHLVNCEPQYPYARLEPELDVEMSGP